MLFTRCKCVISALVADNDFCHLQVKKVLSQAIIAMANNGNLEMEGGQLMIDFTVRQCALPSDSE